eukprot:3553202-Rhodomonas_salina.2
MLPSYKLAERCHRRHRNGTNAHLGRIRYDVVERIRVETQRDCTNAIREVSTGQRIAAYGRSVPGVNGIAPNQRHFRYKLYEKHGFSI